MFNLPHHDGSPRYLDQDQPHLGDLIAAAVRVPHTYPVETVFLRTTRDAEPEWHRAELVDRDAHDQVWRVHLPVRTPELHYRFLLDRGERGYAWLNGTGVHTREVSDAMDFRLTVHPRAPEWIADGVIYQVFPDRFAPSEERPDVLPDWAVVADWSEPVVERGPDTPRQFYGGDLTGVARRLDHLVELGVTVLYLTPVFPAGSNHRYDARTFDEVDPLLGGDHALTALVAAAHERGLRVIGDLTVNHTGVDHDWFRKAVADPTCEEAGFYLFEDHPDRYRCWLGEASLPKLNWRSTELRRRMIAGPDSIVARYLQPPFELDGWRIDVANMTARADVVDDNAEVAATVRATMASVRDDAYLLAEHFHDAASDLRRDGWHGTMNYAGFLRPLWMWLTAGERPEGFLGMPVPTPRVGGEDVVATMREITAQLPWDRLTASTTLLCSHDTARLRTVVGDADRQILAAGILATYPGTPLIFMGDEFGLTGIDGEHARVPMPWDDPAVVDHNVHVAYQRLIALRRDHIALRRGSLRWGRVEADLIVYLREHPDERILVVAARVGTHTVDIPGTLVGDGPTTIFGEPSVRDDGTGRFLTLAGPALAVISL